MAYVNWDLPREKTAEEAFIEGASPYLQMAFQNYYQNKMQGIRKQQAYDEAVKLGLAVKTPYQDVPVRGGKAQIQPFSGAVIPKSVKKKFPVQFKYRPTEGTTIKFSESGIPQFGYEKPQPMSPMVGVYSASPEGTITKTGEVPKGSRVLTPLQMMTPEERSAQAALTKATGEKVGAVTKMQRGEIFLKNIKEQWEKTNPPSIQSSSSGLPVFGYIRGAAGTVGSQKGEMQQVKVYNDFVKGIRSQLARTIGQDVGNLSEYEQQVIISIAPIVSGMNADFRETGENKLNRLNQVIQDIYKARQLGYNDILEMYQNGEQYPSGMKNQQPQQEQGMQIGRFRVEVQ